MWLRGITHGNLPNTWNSRKGSGESKRFVSKGWDLIKMLKGRWDCWANHDE